MIKYSDNNVQYLVFCEISDTLPLPTHRRAVLVTKVMAESLFVMSG